MKRYQRNLTWHEEFLCACALWREDEAQAALSRLLEKSPTAQDWLEAVRHSVRQGIAPLVAQRLRAFMAERADAPLIVPPDVMACLERMLAANARRNQVMLHQYARLLRAFHASGIPCLTLKGVALALSVYPDPSLRNFADIDLLVPSAHYERAGEIAVAARFQTVFAEQDTALVHQIHRIFCEEDILTATLPLEFDADLSRDSIERSRHWIVLEIHRGLFRDAAGFARTVDEAPLWERVLTMCLPDGLDCSLPSAEVMLVHLTTHAATHGFSRLQYPVDIAGVIEHYAPTLDWELVVSLAKRYEVEANVVRGLELAQRVSGACVPESVLQRLTASAALRARPQPIPLGTLFAPTNIDSRDIMLSSLMLSATPRQFLRGLKNMLFPPPLMMRRFYGVRHPAMIALLYVYRPFHMAGRLAQLLFRRLCAKRSLIAKAR